MVPLVRMTKFTVYLFRVMLRDTLMFWGCFVCLGPLYEPIKPRVMVPIMHLIS